MQGLGGGYISRLRRKIDAESQKKLIHTLRGHHYVLRSGTVSSIPQPGSGEFAAASPDKPIRIASVSVRAHRIHLFILPGHWNHLTPKQHKIGVVYKHPFLLGILIHNV